jgi:hypothetical protein
MRIKAEVRQPSPIGADRDGGRSTTLQGDRRSFVMAGFRPLLSPENYGVTPDNMLATKTDKDGKVRWTRPLCASPKKPMAQPVQQAGPSTLAKSVR